MSRSALENLIARGRTSARSRDISDGSPSSPSRKAWPQCSNSSISGGPRPSGGTSLWRRQPKPGFNTFRTAPPNRRGAHGTELPAQDKDGRGTRKDHRSPTAAEHSDHVSWNVRHCPPRSPPPSHLCEGEGGRPGRERHGRRPHSESRPPAVCPPGTPGSESRCARDGGLCDHRSQSNADREYPLFAARLLCKGV